MNSSRSQNNQFVLEMVVWEHVKFFAILGFIFLAALIYTASVDKSSFMHVFMGIFFIVFGAFKLLHRKEFVPLFSSYDIVAKRSPQYAQAYPFVELVLGFAYLFSIPGIEYATVLIMGLGAIGVLKALFGRNKLKYTYFGMHIQLPLTMVSLIENVGMTVWALWLIING